MNDKTQFEPGLLPETDENIADCQWATLVGKLAGTWPDFPMIKEIGHTTYQDFPRESL